MKCNIFSGFALTTGLLAISLIAACNNNNTAPAQRQAPGQGQSLYDKYGGQATIRKVVDDAVTGLLADCVENPFFTQNVINFDNTNSDGNGHGTNGHDTADRLKSCLDSQFTAAFGGPSPYDGTATVRGIPSRTIPGQTYDCEDMTVAHKDTGVTPAAFDQFITDVGGVLKKNGVSDADINTVATALMGFKTQIVAAPNNQKNFNFQPGDPRDQPAIACTVAGPSPTPSPVVSGVPGGNSCVGMADGTPCGGETCAHECDGTPQCGSKIYHYCSAGMCGGAGVLCRNPSPTPFPSGVR